MLPDINTLIYATTLGDNTRPVFRFAVKQALLNRAKIVMV